jgi:hypothetical protein
MKMDAFNAYKIYTALKNHFVLDNYDYFKYNKKIKVSYDTFLNRRDKIFFAKLGNQKDTYLEDFLVSNFLYDTKTWIGELLSDQAEERYKNWKKKQESLTYYFKNEIEFLADYKSNEFNQYFESINGNHPQIIKMYMRKEISIETLTILDLILKFMHKTDKFIHDPIYKEVSKLCKKYQPFLKCDLHKMKKTLKEVVMQE